MLVDTHCHLHFDAFDADREAVIDRARSAGVKYLVNVGTDPATNEAAWKLASKYSFMVHTAGLHPHSAHLIDHGAGESATRPYVDVMDEFIRQTKPAAIGEVGLDYFKSEADPKTQKKVFVDMLHMAMRNDLPVIVHSRNAFEDTLAILKSEGQGQLKGVMHCFSYDKAALSSLMDIGFLASFTANITYKSAAGLLEAAVSAPLDRIMLETDSPYLAPQTLRGQRNEPAHLIHAAKLLADKRGVPLEELEAVTSRTALSFFRIPAGD